MTKTHRIAIVIPWFGRELKGGAELHAWQLATRLAGRGHAVEVLTTCCRAHSEDWGVNHLPAGSSDEGAAEGFSVKRFKVEPRDAARFDLANSRLLSADRSRLRPGVSPVSAEDEEVFCSELIRSRDLLAYIAQHQESYDAILLLPYLYGPVIAGVHLASGRALLQPCLHDEAYAYLPKVARAVYAAKRLLFLSEGERQLAVRLYGPGIIGKSIVSGAGVDFACAEPDDTLLRDLGDASFVLCLGKKDPGKNTDFLANCFAQYKSHHPNSTLRLVIAGPGRVELPPDCPGLVEFGVVSEAQKRSLLRHCAALFHPSENESYSRVIMEAWLEGRPAAAHERCLATSTAVLQGGGWLAASAEQWVSLFARVDEASSGELDDLGERGRRAARELASWDAVIERYEAAIEALELERLAPRHQTAGPAKAPVHQILPNVAVGDAISNHALWIKAALRGLGHDSEIFALGIDPRLAGEVRSFNEYAGSVNTGIIYHHSIGSPATPAVIAHPGPKCLVYHNITPHSFLEPYLPLHTKLCREGRAELPTLARHFPLSVGDSIYNAIELSESGFPHPGVLPICVNPSKWQIVPDPALMERLQDGRTNILFVGRLSPNKRQEDLILAFSELRKLDPGARLILVGTSVTEDDLYLDCLRAMRDELGLGDSVELAGHVSDEQLVAYYRTAHLFWSMSEHEGFCVPLIEAMWFDVPVLAYASSAVPETLSGAGCLFATKRDLAALARQALLLATDAVARRPIIDGQRVRRTEFLEEPVSNRLETLVSMMLGDKAMPVTAPRQEIDPLDVRRIAVVKLDHIGDLLLATPVFESLHRRFPGATITAVVAPASAGVLDNNPHVAQVVTYDPPWFWRDVPAPERLSQVLAANTEAMKGLARQPFDLVVNLRSDLSNLLFAASIPHKHLLGYTNNSNYAFLLTHALTRTRGMHITEQHRLLLETIGAGTWSKPSLYPSDRDRRSVAKAGRAAPGTVAVFAGAGIPLKCWSSIKFRELVRRLRSAGIPVALVGSAADAEVAAEIADRSGALNLCGQFTLLELAVYLADCAVLVTNDSAPMHIGAAMGTPVVYITRPLVVEEFAPVGSQHLMCCLPQCANACAGFDPEARGELRDFCRCIQSIGVNEVESKVWDCLGEAAIKRSIDSKGLVAA